MRKIRVRAIIPYDGKFLFVQQKKSQGRWWALPGGKLEDGETLQDGLSREIVEELGVVPRLGRLAYVQQLFMPDHESLEFFFVVENGADFVNFDLEKSSHGKLELQDAAFIDPATKTVLPEFLANVVADLRSGELPKVFVGHVNAL